jgi:hypothetical protein
VGRLAALAAALTDDALAKVTIPAEAPLTADSPVPVPDLVGYPRTVAATELLTSAIARRAATSPSRQNEWLRADQELRGSGRYGRRSV